jgi:hypothetical protein
MRPTAQLVFYGVLCCAAALTGGLSQAQGVGGQRGPLSNPGCAGDALPAPPRQAAAWTAPPTKLPKKVVSAAETLFRQGLADPRGCPYCAIELDGDCFLGREAAAVSTHGWLIPASNAHGPRFAICWNGVAYPLLASGKPANLRADVRDAIQAGEEARRKGSFRLFDPAFDQNGPAAKASYETPRRVWACLLLRLGEVELAEKTWAVCTPAPATPHGPPAEPDDPYLDLAQDWTSTLLDRAIYAHLHGNDPLALRTAAMLAPLCDAVEAEAARRGCPPPEPPQPPRKPSYLQGLAAVPALLADQKRRAAQRQAGKSPPVLPAPGEDSDTTLDALRQALARCPDETQRIAMLVQELEEVSAGGYDQFGPPDPASDPVIRLLIEAGEPAVEPLVRCLEDDMRLTRSLGVDYGNRAPRDYGPVGVSAAAYVALAAILDADFFGNAIPGDAFSENGKPARMTLAKRIRGYFHKYRGLPRPERWYRIVLDDRAPMRWWVHAARKIAEPADAASRPGGVYDPGWFRPNSKKPGAAAKPAGEPLRGKKDPTVSELLAQRVRELPREMAWAVGLALADWDPQAALPVLRRLTEEVIPGPSEKDNPGADDLGLTLQAPSDGTLGVPPFIDLILARIEIHDPRALEDYGRWARAVARKKVNGWRQMPLAPLLRYPDEPAARATAEWLFNDPASPWSNVFRHVQADEWPPPLQPLASPLLALPAFRRQVARLLTDRRPAGHAKMIDGQQVEMKANPEWLIPGGPLLGVLNDAPSAPAGASAEFRVCDLAAHELAAVRGLPRCELYWPESRRDKAVAASARFLQQYGQRLQSYDGSQPASIVLPALDRPATPEDVQEGRAIFTLAGQGPARAVPLSERPVRGRSLTLKDYPTIKTVVDPETGQQKTVAGYDQDGAVWQAEEVQVGGAWRRYFGFVGRHGLAKVPAEEIDFSSEGDWAIHWEGCEIYSLGPGQAVNTAAPLQPWIGGPLPAVISVCNCTGLDRRPPRLAIQEEGAARPKDAIGLGVALFYADRRPGESFYQQQGRVLAADTDTAAWRQLPRKAAPLCLRPLDRPLKPAESFDILPFDVRDHFQLAGKGWYRIVIKLHTGRKRADEPPPANDEFFIEGKPVTPPR